MKTKTIIILLWISLALNLLFASLFIYLSIKGPHNNQGIEEKPCEPIKVDRTEQALDLDSMQRKKFHALKSDHRATIKPLIDQIKEAKNRMFNEFRKDVPDTIVVAKEIKLILTSEEKIHQEMVHHILSVKPILTKEQFSKFINRFENIMHCQRDSGMHKKGKHNPTHCCNNQ